MMIETRNERERGCGFRKPGGLYLISGEIAATPCGKLPLVLDVCPTCGGGIKPTRGWTWVSAAALFAERECKGGECETCPLAMPGRMGRTGLIWIGGSFYKRPHDFTAVAIPKGIEVGKTWVLLAHRQAVQNPDGSFSAAIFHAYRPTAIEYVVKDDDAEEKLERMIARGVTLVRVNRIGEQKQLESVQSV